jgi:hypothetical protein
VMNAQLVNTVNFGCRLHARTAHSRDRCQRVVMVWRPEKKEYGTKRSRVGEGY